MERNKKEEVGETLEELTDTEINDDIEPMEDEDYDNVIVSKPVPKKKKELTPAKKAHLLKIQKSNRERWDAEKEAKVQLLKDAKEIVKARKTIKELNIKEEENKKLMDRAKKSVNGRGRPKKPLLESEEDTSEASDFKVEEEESEDFSEVEVIHKPKKKPPAKKPVEKPKKKVADTMAPTPPTPVPQPRQWSFFV